MKSCSILGCDQVGVGECKSYKQKCAGRFCYKHRTHITHVKFKSSAPVAPAPAISISTVAAVKNASVPVADFLEIQPVAHAPAPAVVALAPAPAMSISGAAALQNPVEEADLLEVIENAANISLTDEAEQLNEENMSILEGDHIYDRSFC